MEVFLRAAVDNSTLVQSVMGGVAASAREFPFQVGINYDDRFYCGGSIISSVFILTAAHCVHNLSAAKFKVTAGDLNRLVQEGTEQVQEVSKIFVHPEYRRATLDNDIALMVLKQPFQFNTNVGKIKFLKANSTHSGIATVSGWGQLKHGGSAHDLLQKVDVPIIASPECIKMFRDGNFNLPIPDDVLCAGSVGKDACKGDSGGPLSARLSSKEEVLLVGVVSWGAPCNDTGTPSVLPGVYINVSKYSKWIDETMMKFGRESGRCQPDEFYCPTENVCIFSQWVCDGDKDCSQGEDESPGLCSLPCPPSQFQCEGGKCISPRWTCDGRPDCPNGEDENNCETCKPGAVKCSGERKCYSATSICDGNHDCRNGEDERGCVSCHGRGFHCKGEGKCIPWNWKCDGEEDCSTKEDEAKCLCFLGVCFNLF